MYLFIFQLRSTFLLYGIFNVVSTDRRTDGQTDVARRMKYISIQNIISFVVDIQLWRDGIELWTKYAHTHSVYGHIPSRLFPPPGHISFCSFATPDIYRQEFCPGGDWSVIPLIL